MFIACFCPLYLNHIRRLSSCVCPNSTPFALVFCQVKDDDRPQPLGSLTIPLTRLLASPELTMDQWFQLTNSAGRIYIKIVLRVCI